MDGSHNKDCNDIGVYVGVSFWGQPISTRRTSTNAAPWEAASKIMVSGGLQMTTALQYRPCQQSTGLHCCLTAMQRPSTVIRRHTTMKNEAAVKS